MTEFFEITELDPRAEDFRAQVKSDMMELADFDALLAPVLEKADTLRADISNLVSGWVAAYVSKAHLCLHICGSEKCGSVSYTTEGNLFASFTLEELMEDAIDCEGEDEFLAWLKQVNETAKEIVSRFRANRVKP